MLSFKSRVATQLGARARKAIIPPTLLVALWFGAATSASAYEVLDNGKLRFGNGSEASVNSQGNLQQPFYYDVVLGGWYPLTYSTYPLDNAIRVAGDGTNEWNVNGSIGENAALTGQTIDTSGFTVTSGSNGTGTIVSTGTVTIGGSALEVTNTYTLEPNKSFVRIVTRITNNSAATVTNVRLWVGTRDDNVAGNDRPTKVKGNIVNGAFTQIPTQATRSSALQIYTNDTGILFYSTSPKANMAINGCCQFSKAYNQDPATSVINSGSTDGSYALFVRMDDLAVGASEDFTWYYAAGDLASLTTVITDVSNAAATNFTVTASAGTGGTISPASVDVATGATTALTVAPDAGYIVDTVQGCGGSLSGNTYTTGAITAACAVTATFRANTFTVTATAGTGGSITPPTATVNSGETTSFTLVPDAGHSIEGASGCGGSLSGSTFTTAAVSANCSVAATFVVNQYAVTTSTSDGGVVSPASALTNFGGTASFTVAPAPGYSVASASGCGGTLAGSTFTSGQVTAACEISVEFAQTLPTFTPVQPVVYDLQATALTTELPSGFAPTAVDFAGNELSVTLVSDPGRLAPGLHTLTWRAVDSRGIASTLEQVVRVFPLVSMGKDVTLGFQAGNSSSFRIALNGVSPVYPLTVGYTVSGYTTGNDLEDGAVVFASGETEKDVFFAITAPPAAGLSNQQAAVQLQEGLNLDRRDKLTVTLVTANVAPTVSVSGTQEGVRRSVFSRASDVALIAQVQDANSADTHTLQWVLPTGALATVSGAQVTLHPGGLGVGVHRFEVVATDNGNPALSSRGTFDVVLRDNLPALPPGVLQWAANGLPDDPAYNPSTRNVLPEQSGELTQFLIEGDPGVQMRLGPYALFLGEAQSQVSDGGSSPISADSVNNIGGYFDFIVSDLAEAGQSVNVVVPQRVEVPPNAVYRKYVSASRSWKDFVQNTTNSLASAPGKQGFCPPPSSTEYRAGLNVGDWCVRLTISDGGPNDDDGQMNGAISDPGGVAALKTVVVTTKGEGNRGGGGGAMGVLWPIFGLAMVVLRNRRKLLGAPAVAVIGALLCALAAPSVFAQGGDRGWYVGGELGRAHGTVGESELNARLASAGYLVTARYDDQTRTAWNAHVGYQLIPYLALQAGYTDLGEIGATISGNAADIDALIADVARFHPRSATGAELSLVGRYPFLQKFAVTGTASLFRWNAKYRIADASGASTRAHGSDTAFAFGAGLEYAADSRWRFSANWNRYSVESEHIRLLGLGVNYHF